jgi:hypothetical protein
MPLVEPVTMATFPLRSNIDAFGVVMVCPSRCGAGSSKPSGLARQSSGTNNVTGYSNL